MKKTKAEKKEEKAALKLAEEKAEAKKAKIKERRAASRARKNGASGHVAVAADVSPLNR